MLLLAIPAPAAPVSVLINGIIKQSPGSNTAGLKSEINPFALIEDIKKKHAETNEKPALMPPNDEITGPPSMEADKDNMTRRRMYLKQLVYLYEGQLSRLENL
jgi:hypothetical protein